MPQFFSSRTALACALLFTAWIGAPASASAQDRAPAPAPTLRQAFEQAWQHHPATRALPDRRLAAQAGIQAAQAWTAQGTWLELSHQRDRPGNGKQGQEWEAGVSWTLWWPGQRARAQRQAHDEAQALDALTLEAQLQLAQAVREAWWAWQRAQLEQNLAEARVAHAQALSRDVAQRLQAGELARADAHQAEGALALAESALTQSRMQRLQAEQGLRALQALPASAELGSAPLQPPAQAEALPAALIDAPRSANTNTNTNTNAEAWLSGPELDRHPRMMALARQAQALSSQAELAETQAWGNPELTLGTVQSHEPGNEPLRRAVVLGLRLPLGTSPAQTAQAAKARAEASERQAQAEALRWQLRGDIELARRRLQLSREQLAAAQRRARLAQETLAFFDKSFRLGESDLPTRLRIALEAQEAERQAALAGIEVGAATSALGQAAGLLPH